MSKDSLHSLLAVETDLRNVATKVINEAQTTFQKRDDHFEGLVKTYSAFKEEDEFTNTTEHKEIVTTVAEKLNYLKSAVSKGIDALISKEETNSSGEAIAKLAVAGQDFGELSATSLLALEKELTKIRGLYSSIPTLDPAKSWKRNEMTDGVSFQTEPVSTIRTTKTEDFQVIVPPTEHHPAHVEKVIKNENIGKYETVYKSGKLTPLMKSQALGRIDELLVAVKKARSEANSVTVKRTKVGENIFSFINQGIV